MALVESLFVFWLALIGLSVGSFLNVVIARLPAGESVVRPRSRCPRCGHQLPWYENVPVFSWLLLRGRCSSCKAPISPRYILVELLTGSLFLAALVRFGWTLPLVNALLFICLLIPLVFIDAEHWVLPFELTLPGIATALLLHAALGRDAFFTALWGVVAGFLVFRVMEFIGWLYAGTEALGAGDKYLLAMAGGALGARAVLGVVLLSALQGAIFGALQLWRTGRAGPPLAPEPDPRAAPVPGPGPAGEQPTLAPSAEAKLEVAAPATTSPLAAPVEQGRGPAVPEPEPEARREPFTPAFLRPGVPLWRRVVLVPYTLLFQDIPDPPPPDEHGEEPDWVPGATSLPFGPWIGLAALEVMLAGPALAAWLGPTALGFTAELLFGG